MHKMFWTRGEIALPSRDTHVGQTSSFTGGWGEEPYVQLDDFWRREKMYSRVSQSVRRSVPAARRQLSVGAQ